jgi:SAM-dependent methyltransferase
MFRSTTGLQGLARCCVLSLLLTLGLQAQATSRADCEQQFKAERGQMGKDVVWIPTNDELVVRMLQMANVTAADRVYDLGAGDGKIAIAAAKRFGAKAVGVEFNPELAKLGACFAAAEGVADRVRIVQGDIFETDFSDASVVTLYLLPELNLRLRPTLLKMPPGTRVVSHSFLMDDWQPDDRSTTEDGQAYLWIVPANVEGSWEFRQQGGKDAFRVRLKQSFQQLEGTAGKRNDALTQATLNGTRIALAFTNDQPVTVTGDVNGDRIVARVTQGGKTSDYIGTRR